METLYAVEAFNIEAVFLESETSRLNDERIKDAWFEFEGDLVVWIRYAVLEDSVSLWGIETRPGYLNNGFASRALELVKQKYEVSIIEHDGGYTPEGEMFIAKLLRHTGDPREHFSYPSMNFVTSWDRDNREA